MWIAISIAVVVAALVVYAALKPGIRRRRAIREAVDRAEAAVRKDPSDLSAKVALARVQLDLAGNAAEALRLLQEVRASDPCHWSGERPARVIEGEAYVALGQLDRAIATFESFVASIADYATGGDSERKWQLETFKVDAEQRIRLLKKGDTHVHRPEQWGDAG